MHSLNILLLFYFIFSRFLLSLTYPVNIHTDTLLNSAKRNSVPLCTVNNNGVKHSLLSKVIHVQPLAKKAPESPDECLIIQVEKSSWDFRASNVPYTASCQNSVIHKVHRVLGTVCTCVGTHQVALGPW